MAVRGQAAADALGKLALRLIAKHPDAPAKTLGRRLQAESNGALTLDQAYSRIRYYLGLKGEKHRVASARVNRATRPPRKPGEILAMPKSMAEPWVPYTMDVLGPVGIISDVHVPYHSEIAVAAAVGFLKDQNLSGLLLNGDIADFYAISRYMKDPTQRDFKGELEAVRTFIAWIRSEFPDIPIVLKEGNHEYRWKAWLYQHAAEISDDPRMSLGAWLDLDKHGVELVEDQRPIMLGQLPVFHGHELPRGMAAPVNVARGVWMRMKGTGLVGHHHRTSNHAESDWRHKETANWSVGCLCDLTPEYARVNSWNWGAAVVNVHKGGAFDVNNYRVMGDGTVRSA